MLDAKFPLLTDNHDQNHSDDYEHEQWQYSRQYKKSSPLRIDIFVTDKLSDYYQKFMKIFRTLSLDNRGESGGGGVMVRYTLFS